HIAQSKAVGFLTPDRLRFGAAVDVVPSIVFQPSLLRRARPSLILPAAARRVFPLGLGWQTVMLPRLFRQPLGIFDCIIPRYVDHRFTAFAPLIVVRKSATCRLSESLVVFECNLAPPDSKALWDVDGVNWFLIIAAKIVNVAHLKRTR